MEILSKLSKTTTKSQKRLGRGIGSGVGGHTTGRGQKGDKARGASKLTFDGTKIKKSWIKRLPFLRGKHRLQKRISIVAFNLTQLDKWFKKDELVDVSSLSKKTKISLKDLGARVKILSNGSLTKPLNFKGILVSQPAAEKIKSIGGKIE